jgi:hypothetical protein
MNPHISAVLQDFYKNNTGLYLFDVTITPFCWSNHPVLMAVLAYNVEQLVERTKLKLPFLHGAN